MEFGGIEKAENSTGLKNLHADSKNNKGLAIKLTSDLSQQNNFTTRTCDITQRKRGLF